MGKNTSDRQDFIIENLRVDIDQLRPEDEEEMLEMVEEEVVV